MSGVKLNDGNFEQEVKNEQLPVLVDFWAEWCGPCRMIAPMIDDIAAEYDGKLKVCKLNVDDAPDTAKAYEVMSIPTLLVFKGGEVVDKCVGAVSKDVVKSKITPHI